MSLWGQFSFPDPMTQMAGRLFYYHETVLIVVVMVLVLVGWFLNLSLGSRFFFDGGVNKYTVKNEWLEMFWTVTPALILSVLCFVSLNNLYDMEVGDNVDHVLKVTGHQWYWDYRYEVNFCKTNGEEHSKCLSDWLSVGCLNYGFSYDNPGYLFEENEFWSDYSFNNKENFILFSINELFKAVTGGELNTIMKDFSVFNIFSQNSALLSIAELFMTGDWFLKYDSYMVPEEELESGKYGMNSGFRNGDVKGPCYLAHGKKNEVLVTSSDVMHSWGVSELGVKADAIPGRVNSLSVEPVTSGVAFGNCYELCGEGHSQMPVMAFVLDYLSIIWILKKSIMETDFVVDYLNSL